MIDVLFCLFLLSVLYAVCMCFVMISLIICNKEVDTYLYPRGNCFNFFGLLLLFSFFPVRLYLYLGHILSYHLYLFSKSRLYNFICRDIYCCKGKE